MTCGGSGADRAEADCSASVFLLVLLKRETGEVAGVPGLIRSRPGAVMIVLGYFATDAKHVIDCNAVSLVC